MRILEGPVVDDIAILDAVAAHHSLADCPYLQAEKLEMRRRYGQFTSAGGNAAAGNAPRSIVYPGQLQRALYRRYDSGAEAYDYIVRIRDDNGLNACPMCGSPNLGSVDHIFPRAKFPELAIYSHNLVPACLSCNSPRQDSYLGAMPGERVLHPYFDRYLDERLITAKLSTSEGGYRRAGITVGILLHTMHPLYSALRFHLREVVLKSKILKELDKLWVAFQRLPDVYFQSLADGAFTNVELSAAVDKSLSLSDKEFSTPNNWKSFLLYGLAENPEAKVHLADTIRGLRDGTLDPTDI